MNINYQAKIEKSHEKYLQTSLRIRKGKLQL